MNFAFENIPGHLRSTLTGVILGFAILFFVWPLRVATMEEIMPALLIIVPFLLYGNQRPGGSSPLLWVAALCLIGLTSCKKEQLLQESTTVQAMVKTDLSTIKEKATKKDSTHIVERETLVKIPGAKVTAGIDLDSLLQVVNAVSSSNDNNQAPAYFTKKDSTGKAELRYWMDAHGRLQMECHKLEDYYKNKEKETFHLLESALEESLERYRSDSLSVEKNKAENITKEPSGFNGPSFSFWEIFLFLLIAWLLYEFAKKKRASYNNSTY